MSTTKNEYQIINDKFSTMSIKIDGNWRSEDFIVFFKCFEFIYDYYNMFAQVNRHISGESNLTVLNSKQKPSARISEIILMSAVRNFDYDPLDPLNKRHQQNTISSNTFSSLNLKKVQYASPGSIDFIGMGEIFKTIKEIIFHYIPNKRDKLDNQKIQLENTEKEIEILKKLGYDDLEIQALVLKKNSSITHLQRLESTGMLTGSNIDKLDS